MKKVALKEEMKEDFILLNGDVIFKYAVIHLGQDRFTILRFDWLWKPGYDFLSFI